MMTTTQPELNRTITIDHDDDYTIRVEQNNHNRPWWQLHNQSWTERSQLIMMTTTQSGLNGTRMHVRRMQIPSRLQTCLAMADTSHTVSGIHAKSVVTAKHVVATRHSQNCGHKRGAYHQQFTKLCTKCRPNIPQKVPTLSLYRCLHEPSMNHTHLP